MNLDSVQWFNQYSMLDSIFNEPFIVQWAIHHSMHICYLTDHSMFNKPIINVQWAIRCSILIQYSRNHSMWFKVSTVLGMRWAVLRNDGAVSLIIMNNNDNDNNAPLFGQLVVMEENIWQLSYHLSEASQLLSSMLCSESSYSSV